MNIEISHDVYDFIERRVRSGEYADASAVVAEAIRLLESHERTDEGARTRILRIVKEGLDDLALGRTTRGDIVFAALKQRAAVMRDEA